MVGVADQAAYAVTLPEQQSREAPRHLSVRARDHDVHGCPCIHRRSNI